MWDASTLLFYLYFSGSVQSASLPCDWRNGTGKLTPLISGDTLSVTVTTEADCKDQCVSQTSFICAAVNYKPDGSNNCELLTESDKSATEETNSEWSYFIRPLCAGVYCGACSSFAFWSPKHWVTDIKANIIKETN